MSVIEYGPTDPHTYHQKGQPLPEHVDLVIRPDFSTNRLRIRQKVRFNKAGVVHLDSWRQEITGASVQYVTGEEDNLLGSCVTVTVPETLEVELVFLTSPDAKGAQWVSTQQADSLYPVFYTQNEPINGRSIFILPDAPSVRFTYTSKVEVSRELRGLMGAGTYHGRTDDGDHETDYWEMKTPVPSYLVAINIGDFEYRAFDERSGVWANPRVIEQASKALNRTPEILAAAERLFGPYLWGTYTTIALPQRGFPFGAMEHPCMTSMNEMLIWDTRAATRVTIHELMHSWFGNLITNASWNDFWLNEGVTTFGEWLVIREVLGDEAMRMQIALVRQEMRHSIDDFMARGKPEYTCLRIDMTGKDPEESFSRVPYCKGALFLWTLMERVGEERMLNFLRDYIASYRYTSIDTKEFLRFAAEKLGQNVLDDIDVHAWVYEPGMPPNEPVIPSESVREAEALAASGNTPPRVAVAGWESEQWMLYFSKLAPSVPKETLVVLDMEYGFSKSKNGMLQFDFLRAALECVECSPETYMESVRRFLLTYGRTLYLIPLYTTLCKRGRYDAAASIYEDARSGYHPIGQGRVEDVLKRYAPKAA